MDNSFEIPQVNLELFDGFDLDKKGERRAATRVIVDFYGIVLSEIGRSYLGFSPEDLNQGIGPLWRKAAGRFQAVEDIQVPEEYNSLLNRLHQCQNDIDHDFGENPERTVLVEARDTAKEWANWLNEQAKTYEKAVGEQSAQETMIRVARESLEQVKQDPEIMEYDDLVERQRSLNEQANGLQVEVEHISNSTDTISNSLVFLMADALDLEQEWRSLETDYNQRKVEEERLASEREWMNTTPFYVTEPYDEEDPSKGIIMVSDVVGEEDQTISVNPYHPDIPEETRQKLKELVPKKRYRITFEYDPKTGTRYVVKVRE